MIIKNHEIENFGKFLMELKLKGRSSNMRVRFVRLLQERLTLINEESEALFRDYVERDEGGSPKKEVNEETGEEAFLLDREYGIEMAKLMEEDFIIEENDEKALMLSVVRDAIFNCDMELSGQKALQYERWCEIVEDVNSHTED